MTGPAGRERFEVDGNTLFLLGNGPSLKNVNLNDLSAYPTLGMNAAYRYWRDIGWRPRYYACLDTVVGLSHRDAIAGLIEEDGEGAIEFFLLRDNLVEALGAVAFTSRVINFDALRLSTPLLQPDPITTGSHAALWAATAGFRQIALLGVDANYVERVAGSRPVGGIELEITETAPNPNYFFDAYQQKGDRYHQPNPRPGLHVEAWEAAAALLVREGVRVVNANPASAVRFFPFVSAQTLVAEGAAEKDVTGQVAPRAGVGATPAAGEAALAGRLARRLWRFLRRQGRLLAAFTILAAIAALAGRVGSEASGLAVAIGLFYALSLIVLMIRDTVASHMAQRDHRLSNIETMLRDLERRSRAPVAAAGPAPRRAADFTDLER